MHGFTAAKTEARSHLFWQVWDAVTFSLRKMNASIDKQDAKNDNHLN
ncbi:MAG: hypothetical protein HC903_07840 [Methylacidiphilales bacterium]|nr:hypothetical protein [Candidatus Methylacidiphilales bacterium]NJR15468.1 hypothetical protein [Calothrix sp. CSU_2_0]